MTKVMLKLHKQLKIFDHKSKQLQRTLEHNALVQAGRAVELWSDYANYLLLILGYYADKSNK